MTFEDRAEERETERPAYVAPSLVVLGTTAELTRVIGSSIDDG